MNLLQLVELVSQGTSVGEVIARDTSHIDADNIGIYMEDEASLTSQLAFFDVEQVPSTILIRLGGKQYEAFFSATELASLIPEYADFLGAAATPLTIAEAILHYYHYDA